MTNILQSLSKTVHLSLGIAILLLIGMHFFGDGFAFDRYFFSWLFRYIHVLTGIMWIGLLWYFNFVQIPSMPNIPDEQKPAIGKVIAPKALFWFRWAALATIITGLIVAYLNGYVHDAMILGIGSGGKNTAITISITCSFNGINLGDLSDGSRRATPGASDNCLYRFHVPTPHSHQIAQNVKKRTKRRTQANRRFA